MKGRPPPRSASRPASRKGGPTSGRPTGKGFAQKPSHSGKPRFGVETSSNIKRRHDPRARELDPNRHDRWVIGIHSVEEALRTRPRAARELWVREDYLSSQVLRDLVERVQRSKTQVKTKSVSQIDPLGSGHQGVAVAMTESPKLDWEKLKEPGQAVIVVLDGIEDPHNLGSILRTSWLTGVKAILIPEDRAVGLTPSVCKVASGGAEHVAVESHTNIPSVLKDLKDLGFWVYGLSEKGAGGPWKLTLPEKVVWVVGSEGSGIRIPTERACDELVRIPQVESGSSYNAAIAAAMALGETCRQFGKPE